MTLVWVWLNLIVWAGCIEHGTQRRAERFKRHRVAHQRGELGAVEALDVRQGAVARSARLEAGEFELVVGARERRAEDGNADIGEGQALVLAPLPDRRREGAALEVSEQVRPPDPGAEQLVLSRLGAGDRARRGLDAQGHEIGVAADGFELVPAALDHGERADDRGDGPVVSSLA